MFLLVRFSAPPPPSRIVLLRKEERLHQQHLSRRLSRRSRHPAGVSMTRGALSRYCTFQHKDGGEILRQYSDASALENINVEAESCTKESGLQMKQHLA